MNFYNAAHSIDLKDLNVTGCSTYGITVVSLPSTVDAPCSFLAVQRNNVIIKPKTVTHNYCSSRFLNLDNPFNSEYNFKLAQIKFYQ
jgi:hypothetical protein